MKHFLQVLATFIILILSLNYAAAAPQLGITPCAIGTQPSDLAFTVTSSNVHLSTCGETLIAFNNSANDARFRLGSSSATTALTTDLLLPSKSFVVLNVGIAGLYFAAIGSGSGTISFIQGTASN